MSHQAAPVATWSAALYLRLSRDDGDRVESDSISSQRTILHHFCSLHSELSVFHEYVDDGFTGTNFDRPAFQQMLQDLDQGQINCILVKDLSRFGRDYIGAGHYLEKQFPAKGIRFISVNDQIDSMKGAYDMMLPLRNVFNAQYAKDISQKVKSSLKARQQEGRFIGAFASYGYQKDPNDHNHLIVDPEAAAVVHRIFDLYEQGKGKIRIATILNEAHIPCPSEYKALTGSKYHNSNRLPRTKYWTYATIHRILQNQMYIGHMTQAHSVRPVMHGKAVKRDAADWIVVPNTHEAIITMEQWNRVQTLLAARTRTNDYGHNVSPFAGFLKCGDCGRAMAKKSYQGRFVYKCGTYVRYGHVECSPHTIYQDQLEQIVLTDLNQIISSVQDLKQLALDNRPKKVSTEAAKAEKLELALERIHRLKQSSYEDYKDGLLTREEFLAYKADYQSQADALESQLRVLSEHLEVPPEQPWVDELLRLGKLTSLDRITIAEVIEQIRIFEDKQIEITYRFSDELNHLLKCTDSSI